MGIFKKKRSKSGITEKEINEWVKAGLKKGYSFSNLVDILVNHELKEEANRLRYLFPEIARKEERKLESLRKHSQKVVWIVLLISCALVFSLIVILMNGKSQGTGSFINQTENPGAVVNVDFSSDVGTVNPNFYGANTHSPSYMTSATNSTWLENLWKSSGMTIERKDLNVGSYFGGAYDFDFETWINTSGNLTQNNNGPVQSAYGWGISPQFGNGSFAQTADSHSGDYALQVNSTTGFLYLDRGDGYGNIYFVNNTVYNISFWIKGQGTAYVHLQREDNYQNCIFGTTTITLSDTWTQYNYSCLINNPNMTSYRLTIDSTANSYTNFTIDDFNLTYANGTEYTNWETNNSGKSISDQNWTNELAFANSTNTKILFICEGTPGFLANTSPQNYCSGSDCPPTNATQWAQLCADKVNEWSNNGQYSNFIFEITNEPYLSSWMNGLSHDNPLKDTPYNLMYNASYWEIKSVFPDTMVGGGGDSNPQNAPNMYNSFLTFLAGPNGAQIDFFPSHWYTDPIGSTIITQTNKIINNFTSLNVPYNEIYWNEINLCNVTEKNSTSLSSIASKDYSILYSNLLNNFPTNVFTSIYQWTEKMGYPPNNLSNYPEYPQKWTMVNGFDDEISPSYNVTQNFAEYNSPGSMIVKSNSSTSNITVVASEKNDSRYVTVINNGTTIDVGLNIFSDSNSEITDLVSGEVYNITDGGVDIGNMSQYQVRYFEIANSSNISLSGQSNQSNVTNISRKWYSTGGGSGSNEEENGTNNTSSDFTTGSINFSNSPNATGTAGNSGANGTGNTSIKNEGNSSIKSEVENDQGFFSISYLILFSLVICGLFLVFYIARAFIRARR